MLVLAGCLEDLPRPSKVDSLRVLAVRAEPPEAAPGDSVKLTALVVDPTGKGRPLTMRWSACLIPERGNGFFSTGGTTSTSGSGYSTDDPGTCSSLPPDAKQNLSKTLTMSPDGREATFVVPPEVLTPSSVAQVYGLKSPTVGTGAPAAVTGQLAEATAAFLTIAGVNVTITLEVTAGTGAAAETLVAYKRVNVSLSTTRNTNPPDVLFHLVKDGDTAEPPKTAQPVPPGGRCLLAEDTAPIKLSGGKWKLTALNIPDPPPKYSVLLGGSSTGKLFDVVEREETLFYSFFSTEGKFGQDIVKSVGSHQVQWELEPNTATPSPAPLWIVARDGRGGTTWCRSDLEIAP